MKQVKWSILRVGYISIHTWMFDQRSESNS